MNKLQPTALERLKADKLRLEAACQAQEQKLGETWDAMRDNAGSLLLSGFSSLLFPEKKSKNKTTEKTTPSVDRPANDAPASFSVADGVALAKSLMPVAWEIVQPLLVNWSIKKARKMLVRLFSSKKKAA